MACTRVESLAATLAGGRIVRSGWGCPGRTRKVEGHEHSNHEQCFAEGQPIPKKYTCDDQDVSPPLRWSGAPKNTASFALIADDPDAPAGTWVHWVFYDMPPTVTELTENVPKSPRLPNGAHQGINDFRRVVMAGHILAEGRLMSTYQRQR